MNFFPSTFYHIINKKKESKLEPIFKEFKNQIDIYQRQFNLTLKSYLKEWEEELENNNDEYQTRKETAEKVYQEALADFKDDEYAVNFALNQSGLEYIEEDHYFKKEEINTEYNNFLDLYSKSILIALYSLNESKLNQIVELSSVIFNKKIKPTHFNSRDYLNSSILYLNLVVEIETNTVDKYISSLKDLQFLRNNIIHNSSISNEVKTSENIEKKYKDLLNYNKETGFIKIVSAKFTTNIFKLLKNFYEELFWLIEHKQDMEIVKNGLNHWLGAIDKEFSITPIKLLKNNSKEKLIYFKVNSKNEATPDFEGKITLLKSSKSTFEFINQIENELISNFLEYEKEINGVYIKEIFEPFNIKSDKHQIKILLY